MLPDGAAELRHQPAEAAVLFSGGRDSSLAVVSYARQQRTVQPLRFITGTGIPSSLPDIRMRELQAAFPRSILDSISLPAFGLVRRIAIATLESDFRDFDGKNLILLGEKIALTALGIGFCQANEIPIVADGTSGYQVEMPEQRAVAVDAFRALAAEFGCIYETPILPYTSSDDVKYELWDCGVSTKSLEGISIFSDSFSYASDLTVSAYIERKLPIVREYLQRNIRLLDASALKLRPTRG